MKAEPKPWTASILFLLVFMACLTIGFKKCNDGGAWQMAWIGGALLCAILCLASFIKADSKSRDEMP